MYIVSTFKARYENCIHFKIDFAICTMSMYRQTCRPDKLAIQDKGSRESTATKQGQIVLIFDGRIVFTMYR